MAWYSVKHGDNFTFALTHTQYRNMFKIKS